MKTVIATDAGASPVGPYSRAIRANGLIFVSGQIPFDPKTDAIVDGGINRSRSSQCRGDPNSRRIKYGQSGAVHRLPNEHERFQFNE
jgi:Endoribonuclease L-PSP